jgi:serine protease AprX
MYRKVVSGWVLILSLLCEAAIAQQYAFQITFTDKNNTPYSLSTPTAYLSPRAIARRTTQGIAIDSTDLPVNATYVDSVLHLTGGIFHTTSRWLNLCTILLADSTQILNLAGRSFINDVQLVGYYSPDLHHRDAATTGAGTSARTTSYGSSYYNLSWPQTNMVNGDYLHNIGYMGQGKLIAVLDAGFTGTDSHPGFDSMYASGRLVDSYNFTYRSTDIYDYDGHGEQVLSTMAAYQPNLYVGSAPLASYALYITEYDPNDQPLELDNLIAGAERADSLGADIITESLGYDIFDPPCTGMAFATDATGTKTVATRAANIATMKGMLFVATAGNDGAGYLTWGDHISIPGDADSALTIGSVTAAGISASTSGYGPNAAGRVKPDVCTLGEGAEAVGEDSSYTPVDGTSFSTPQIAGWAACLWQAHPKATPYLIRQAIIQCASMYTAPSAQMGYGIPNFECTQAVLGVVDTPPPFTAKNWLIALPLPCQDLLKLDAMPPTEGYYTFMMYDMTGKRVLHTRTYLVAGYNAPVDLDMTGLPAGIYTLKAAGPTEQKTIKIEKL